MTARLVAVLVLAVGCGDNRVPASDATIAGDAAIDAAIDAPRVDGPDADPSCTTESISAPLATGTHVTQCSPLAFATNPPTSGSHYPAWANFATYATAIPRGFWVHSMEHGAVVVSYNCPAGCAAEVAELVAYLDARPIDPTCSSPIRHRFVVVPDPLLDVKFAASAWGFAIKMSCLDLDAIGTFIDQHYAQAPENFCTPGFDPTGICP